jgi:hypothetical protein
VTAPVSTTGSSGTMQVTVGGDPVYYYASDSVAGQANGEGSRTSGWHLVRTPAGRSNAQARERQQQLQLHLVHQPVRLLTGAWRP